MSLRFFPIILLIVFATAQFQIETTLEPDTVTVGDQVRLHITVQLPEGKSVTFPDLVSESDQMQITNRELSPDGVTYFLTFWEVGEVTIPAVPVEILEHGQVVSTLSTESFKIQVQSVLDANASDIRDIKGLHAINLPRLRVFLVFGLLLLSLILAVLIWRTRRIKHQRAEKWQAPPDPPHILAAKQLEQLELPALIDVPEAETFYLQLTGIFRDYLENEFFFGAREMTTAELTFHLEHSSFPEELYRNTSSLLNRADLSKFARQVPTRELCQQDVHEVKKLIDEFHAQAPPGIKE